MLVLSRRNDESVIVRAAHHGDFLKVCVLDIRGGRVTLGFEASEHLVVHREEVWERIRADGSNGRPRVGSAPLKRELERWLNDGGCVEQSQKRSAGNLVE